MEHVPGFGKFPLNRIASGEKFCTFVTAHGEVYVYGENSDGLGFIEKTERDPSSATTTDPSVYFDYVRRAEKPRKLSMKNFKFCKAKEVYTHIGRNCLVVCQGRRLFGFASNDDGCLGFPSNYMGDKDKKAEIMVKHGRRFKVPTPHEVPFFIGKNVTNVFIGRYSTYVVVLEKDNTETVYGFGWNRHGNIVFGQPCEGVFHPQKIEIPNEKIVEIASGFGHSLFLTSSQRVYGVGCNDYGEIGIEACGKYIYPKVVSFPNNAKIIQVSCGYCHSLFLSSTRKVYVTGSNNQNQCGTPNIDENNGPVLLDFSRDKECRRVIAGYYISCFITTEYDFYLCGLIFTKTSKGIKVPTLLREIVMQCSGKYPVHTQFVDFVSGQDFSVFLGRDGYAYYLSNSGGTRSDTLYQTNQKGLVRLDVPRIFNRGLSDYYKKLVNCKSYLDVVIRTEFL